MDRAFRMLVGAIGLSLVDAATICATTPARELGLVGHGVLAPEAVADLVVLDANFSRRPDLRGRATRLRTKHPGLHLRLTCPEDAGMALSTPRLGNLVRAAMAASALTTLLAGPGCIDLVGADMGKYVEREEKRFSTTGTPDVALSTFDGSIEIRAWDKPEVEVVVEKRASSKEAAQEIEIHTEQHGNQVTVDVKAPRMTGFAIHFSRSAKLIVSMPASSNVTAKSGDGCDRSHANYRAARSADG